jgi:protein-tyrosine-phosphatase
MTDVLFLCTGNAARSVMAGVALSQLRPDLSVKTAGTLSVDGMPISWRTRAALDDVGLPWPKHASRQASYLDLQQSGLVVALAPEHVEWVRREHPAVAHRTSTLIRLTKELGPSVSGLRDAGLAARLEALRLDEVSLEPWEEVVDPGGGEVDAFIACAREIVILVDRLAELL